jgi:uncharacterized membrane protein
VFRVTTITTHDGTTRITTGAAPWWLRLLSVLIVLALIAGAFVILLPLGLVLLAAGAVLLAFSAVRRWLRGAQSPNGMFDGRRNVRVINPDQPPTSP